MVKEQGNYTKLRENFSDTNVALFICLFYHSRFFAIQSQRATTTSDIYQSGISKAPGNSTQNLEPSHRVIEEQWILARSNVVVLNEGGKALREHILCFKIQIESCIQFNFFL